MIEPYKMIDNILVKPALESPMLYDMVHKLGINEIVYFNESANIVDWNKIGNPITFDRWKQFVDGKHEIEELYFTYRDYGFYNSIVIESESLKGTIIKFDPRDYNNLPDEIKNILERGNNESER